MLRCDDFQPTSICSSTKRKVPRHSVEPAVMYMSSDNVYTRVCVFFLVSPGWISSNHSRFDPTLLSHGPPELIDKKCEASDKE